MKFAYFVSGHGFGHISRSFEIIKELLRLDHEVHLFTERTRFLEDFQSKKLFIYSLSTDIGLMQSTSLDIDFSETKNKIITFLKNQKNLLSHLEEILQKISPGIIISDSSSFPFKLSKKLEIKSFFLGNFTWDFIYQHYSNLDPFYREFAEILSMEYSLADRGLILPFHCPIHSISNSVHTGLVGRKPERKRSEIRTALKFREDIVYLLFSFGAYGLDPNKFNFSNLTGDFRIVTSGLVDFSGEGVLSIEGIRYPDLLSACDAVVTKPGYGILAETYYANTPIIYTDRGNFIEYEYLVRAMNIYHNSVFISKEQLYGMDFLSSYSNLMRNSSKKIEILEDGIPKIIKTFLD